MPPGRLRPALPRLAAKLQCDQGGVLPGYTAATVRPTASRLTVCAGTAVPAAASTAMPLKSQTGNAGEPNANSKLGPDPPDILRETASGNPTGVELTGGSRLSKVKEGTTKAGLESSYLKIVARETKPKLEHIGLVNLSTKSSSRIRPQEQLKFRTQLLQLLNSETAKRPWSMPSPSFPIPAGYRNTVRHWDIPQGGRITDFVRWPIIA